MIASTERSIADHSRAISDLQAESPLTSPAPCVFVMWRIFDGLTPPARPVIVTVSYNEAGRFLDGGERVDNVAMPDAIAAWMRPFVAVHYKPEPRKKVKRNDPFAAGASVRDTDRRE